MLIASYVYASSAYARPFEVADGIAMTRINTGAQMYDTFRGMKAFYDSPDGRSTLVVVRNGNLVTGQIDYRLLIFSSERVRAYVNDQSKERVPRPVPRPVPRTLATFRSSADVYAIDSIVWTADSRRVLFIGRGADKTGQIYSVDPIGGALSQLTRHADDVALFAVADNGKRLLFSAHSPPSDWRDRNARGYALNAQDRLDSLYRTDPSDVWRCCRQYSLDLESAEVTEIASVPAVLPPELWISPSGRWAVARAVLQSAYPSRWRGYEFLQNEIKGHRRVLGRDLRASIETDGSGEAPIFIDQFYLIDTVTGDSRPLLDAPIALNSAGESGQVVWSKNEDRVIVAPTYMPLDGISSEELARRAAGAVIAEIDIRTGAVARLMDLAPSGNVGMVVVDMRRSGAGELEVRLAAKGSADVSTLHLRRADGGQIQIERIEDANRGQKESQSGLEYRIVQDLNTAPEIAGRDLASGAERVLSDLNPRFRELTFGRTELFEWRDRLGRVHVGGLVRPAGADRNQRLPVVVQTYGFQPDKFLLEGPQMPGKAVFAAQALASRGIAVLQMPTEQPAEPDAGTVEPYEQHGETPRFMAKLEGAIDALDASGLIDRARVGLTGFSRSGTQVLGAVTFSKYDIAAAVLGDGAAITPFLYAVSYGTGGIISNSELEMGAAPWADGMKLWLQRSPAFHYDKIRTPMRLESYGKGVDPRWDMYVMLKRFRRPVELYHIPDGNHVLIPPHAVEASQRGTVDWYSFWLNAEEDPDPSKEAQYVRWRKLRTEHEAHLSDLKRDRELQRVGSMVENQ